MRGGKIQQHRRDVGHVPTTNGGEQVSDMVCVMHDTEMGPVS